MIRKLSALFGSPQVRATLLVAVAGYAATKLADMVQQQAAHLAALDEAVAARREELQHLAGAAQRAHTPEARTEPAAEE